MKNLPKNSIPKQQGVKPAQKLSHEVIRVATLGGILVLLAISILIWRSIDKFQTSIDARFAQIENRLTQVSGKVDTVVARNAPPAPRGPDPNRVYTINTAGAPVKGPSGAPLTIVEFSDFQ